MIDNGFETGGNSCPFLGTKYDSATIMAFPSKWNSCYHLNPSGFPILEYQRQYCLLESHKKCPVFLNEISASRTDEVRNFFYKPQRKIKNYWLVALLVIGILSIGGLLIYSKFPLRNESFPAVKPTGNEFSSLPTGLNDINPNIYSASLTGESSPTRITETSIYQPSITPLLGTEAVISSMHTLDMPIGITHRFIIHRMQQGESLGGLAIQYNTSVEAITQVNYVLPDPVWVDWVVVFPIDTNNVAGLPSFEPKMIVESDMTIEDLAEKLGWDLPSLMFYNGLEAGYLVSSGEWLLIPHSGE